MIYLIGLLAGLLLGVAAVFIELCDQCEEKENEMDIKHWERKIKKP